MARGKQRADYRGQLRREIKSTLGKKTAYGESRHDGKAAGTAADKIYSIETFKGYAKQLEYFTNYCWAKHDCRTLHECEKYCREYIDKREEDGLSKYTLGMISSAMIKLYGKSREELNLKTVSRGREEINRSRGSAKRDYNFNREKHADDIRMEQAIGLRRKELTRLRGSALVYRNGRPMLHLPREYKLSEEKTRECRARGESISGGTKGGKERFVEIIGDQQTVDYVVQRLQAAGEDLVFRAGINANWDVHSDRAVYAEHFYNEIIKELPPLEVLPREKIYSCRDGSGGRYYKEALERVSQSMGHNRSNVIVHHYFHASK